MLENSIKESPETSEDAILYFTSQVYKESITEDNVHAKEELDEANLDKAKEVRNWQEKKNKIRKQK